MKVWGLSESEIFCGIETRVAVDYWQWFRAEESLAKAGKGTAPITCCDRTNLLAVTGRSAKG
jgi:hypothetical protein